LHKHRSRRDSADCIPNLVKPTNGAPVTVWRGLLALLVVGLCWAALSGRAYSATTPFTEPHHLLVRKTLALAAFAVAGFVVERCRFQNAQGWLVGSIVIGMFSGVIEIGQIVIDHTSEMLPQHGFDVVSGISGGAFGALMSGVIRAPRLVRGRDVAIVAALLIATLAWYPWTYGRFG
jgi:hypothetical protein